MPGGIFKTELSNVTCVTYICDFLGHRGGKSCNDIVSVILNTCNSVFSIFLDVP